MVKFLTGLALTFGVLISVNLIGAIYRQDKSEFNGSLMGLAVCGAWLLARYVI